MMPAHFALLFLRLCVQTTPDTPDDVMTLTDTHAPVPVLVTTETDDLILEALMLQTIPPHEPFVIVHQSTRPQQAQDDELPRKTKSRRRR